MNVYVGGDVSKGYADFCLMDREGEIVLEIQMDDTHQGHSRMSELIRECHRKVGSGEELEIALEATGGMERNWLQLFRELDESGDTELDVYRFNPLVIRRFAEQQLHTDKTDEISARVLADYLRLGLAEKKAACTNEGPDDGLGDPGPQDTAHGQPVRRAQKRAAGAAPESPSRACAICPRPHEPVGSTADKAVSDAERGGKGWT
jgi:hypothetical protein